MALLGRLFWFLTLFSTIVYVTIHILFSYTYIQSCEGTWGKTNPPLEAKSGYGRCEIIFDVKFRPYGLLQFNTTTKFFQIPDPLSGNASSQHSLLNWRSYYEGDWFVGQKHGRGTFVGFSGNKYTGEFKFDARNGLGEMRMADGTSYTGSWQENHLICTQCEISIDFINENKYPEVAFGLFNGTVYSGGISHGLMHGDGSIVFARHQIRNHDRIPRIMGEFYAGAYRGGPNGKIILSDDSIVQVERFQGGWQHSQYKVDARMKILSLDPSSSLSQSKVLVWNGLSLDLLSEESSLTIHSHSTPVVSLKAASFLYLDSNESNKTLGNMSFPTVEGLPLNELFEVLNALKWFEYHVQFTKQFVEADMITFQHVDKQHEEKKAAVVNDQKDQQNNKQEL